MGLRDTYASRDSDGKENFQGNARRTRRQAALQRDRLEWEERIRSGMISRRFPRGRRTVVAEIQVVGPAKRPSLPQAGGRDCDCGQDLHSEAGTRSARSRRISSAVRSYMKIFEANKDVLTDPDRIKPGPGAASAVATPRPRTELATCWLRLC